MMAEAQLFISQDEFICAVCREILSDPVSIPCGHNFCIKCINIYWDKNKEYRCPQCRRRFTPRPELHINAVLNEVTKKIKNTGLSSPPSKNYAGSGDVKCDACTGKKFRAVKSCLTCMASYCKTHLQPHYDAAALKYHKLTDPDGNLKEKLCARHQKNLEIFCKTDEICVCPICGVTEHNSHQMVKLETERKEKQKQLGATWIEVRRRLEMKEKKLKETRRTVEQMKEAPRGLTWKIGKQENREIENAEKVMEHLRTEIEELKWRDNEMRELSQTKDHVHFLQLFSFLCDLPADRDSLCFTVIADFSKKELSCLKKSGEKISQWDSKTRTPSAPMFTLQPLEPQSREQFLQYFCPLTLDINTANRLLCLSEGNKKVTWEWNDYPYHPDRFDHWSQVLCREALIGTRHYWEVECSRDLMRIGVAYKGLSRKGEGWECVLGNNDKSWCLLCFNSKYFVCHNNKQTIISAPYSPRIGVYLDWLAGSLSFYSVSYTMTLLHKFNTSFTDLLYPGFWLGSYSCVTISHLTSTL
ncbi:E3 ubiquitin/ISG15 ligase TRIM25-like [Erpetoichthys calabaricus]|uniref:E3 ubiquitin/ISG15 ligase TRIM25-like n=1 Tax=Erpetoichthys calabaricus TaxID=27687 RepID=UPI002234A3E1|nr:E3 ubiquitin/ISG15 ligase TRIM25-like [Erpetoichthys calabaricus]